jgi:hypothetical protein
MMEAGRSAAPYFLSCPGMESAVIAQWLIRTRERRVGGGIRRTGRTVAVVVVSEWHSQGGALHPMK